MTGMPGIFFEGVLLGLVLSITLGPAFFTIIQTSIDRGFRSAFLIAVGVITSDLFIISISFFGLSAVIETGKNQTCAGIIGGVILIMYGVFTFFKKPEILKRRSSLSPRPSKDVNAITFLAKGFFLNLLNPFIIIFWLTILGYISQMAQYGKLEETTIVFLSGTLLTVFSMDVLKSFIGFKIKKYLKPRIQLLINRIVGISLVVFGLVLIIRLLI